ncbi:hypothetical protein CEXT_405291 [Caerostris extrusa]|uniref:Uncharacterized protein n=1 Tax=Caerostris extrusa TaxID=172846 RepID=A0AAV4VHI2_CAEEX|nr:hypothetical protein CEXT_405291 [Caerostris extrusa]
MLVYETSKVVETLYYTQVPHRWNKLKFGLLKKNKGINAIIKPETPRGSHHTFPHPSLLTFPFGIPPRHPFHLISHSPSVSCILDPLSPHPSSPPQCAPPDARSWGRNAGESCGSSGGINYSTGTLISKPLTWRPDLMNSATPCEMQMNAFQRQTRSFNSCSG